MTDKKQMGGTEGQKGNPANVVLEFSRTLQEYGLSSISYEGKDANGNDVKVRIESSLSPQPVLVPGMAHPAPAVMHHAPVAQAAPLAQATSAASAPAATEASKANTAVIKSPMIGVIYVAPKPDAAPFIKVGDRITKGQDLFIIECMKTMNPVKSTHSGVVKEILAQNGKPVEYDQQLVLIEVE